MPPGETGEICVLGPAVFAGYWKNPEANAKSFRDGWFRTGDVGHMDAEGYVYITGRSSDMYISGGSNIYPREIEEFLYTHPEVADAQVIGVPSEKYGEEVMAWVKPKEGCVLDDATLHAFCKGQIATFKIPRFWKFTEDFPMTVTGKVIRKELRAWAADEMVNSK